jgi:hypothetical protein
MTLFLPEVLLPSQLGARRGAASRPELRLITALFEDALQIISRGVESGSGRRRDQEFQNACNWVLSEESDWPFAFVNVCEFLGLDIWAVRKRVRAVIAMQRVQTGSGRNDRCDPCDDPHVRREMLTAREAEQRRFEIVGWDEV